MAYLAKRAQSNKTTLWRDWVTCEIYRSEKRYTCAPRLALLLGAEHSLGHPVDATIATQREALSGWKQITSHHRGLTALQARNASDRGKDGKVRETYQVSSIPNDNGMLYKNKLEVKSNCGQSKLDGGSCAMVAGLVWPSHTSEIQPRRQIS